LKAVILSQRGAVKFHFEVNLKLSEKELKEKFKKVKDQDITDLKFLTREEYVNWMSWCGSETVEILVGVVKVSLVIQKKSTLSCRLFLYRVSPLEQR